MIDRSEHLQAASPTLASVPSGGVVSGIPPAGPATGSPAVVPGEASGLSQS